MRLKPTATRLFQICKQKKESVYSLQGNRVNTVVLLKVGDVPPSERRAAHLFYTLTLQSVPFSLARKSDVAAPRNMLL